MSTFFALIVACSATCANDCNDNSHVVKNIIAFAKNGETYATSSQCGQDWLADARCHVACDGEDQVIINRQGLVDLGLCESAVTDEDCTTVDCAEYNRIYLEEGLGGSGAAATSSPAITVSDLGKYTSCIEKCPIDGFGNKSAAPIIDGDFCAIQTIKQITCIGACGVSYLTPKDRENVVSNLKANQEKSCEILKEKSQCDALNCDQYYTLLGHASTLPIPLFMLAYLLV